MRSEIQFSTAFQQAMVWTDATELAKRRKQTLLVCSHASYQTGGGYGIFAKPLKLSISSSSEDIANCRSC